MFFSKKELSRRICEEKSLAGLTELLFKEIDKVCFFDYKILFIPDEEQKKLTIYQASFPDFYKGMEQVARGLHTLLSSKGIEQECFIKGIPLCLSDQAPKENTQEGFSLHFEKNIFKTALFLPIRYQNQSKGLISLYSKNSKISRRRFNSLLNLIHIFRGQFDTCLHIYDLEEENKNIQNLILRNKAIFNISNELNLIMSKEAIYKNFMEKLCQIYGFDIASIQLEKQGKLPIVEVAWIDEKYRDYPSTVRSIFSQEENSYSLIPGDGACVTSFLNNTHFYFEDIRALKSLAMAEKDRKSFLLFETIFGKEYYLQSILMVPIQESSRPVGVMQLWSINRAVILNITDIEVIKNICAFISTTIKNSELYEDIFNQKKIIEEQNRQLQKELCLARKIQENMIPRKNPVSSAVEFFSIYQPMEEVGGDFYDFVRVREPNLSGVFISDVSGHGVPAALITAMIKTLLETSGESKIHPARLLAYINEKISGQTGGNFLTAFYGIFNHDSGIFTYARGAHEYPLLLRQGQVTPLESRGKMLGVHEDLQFEECQIALVPGDKILFFTDGLTEAVKHGSEESFEEQLSLSLIRCSELSIKDFVQSVYQDLKDFRGAPRFEDDVCIIGMEIL